jgi:glycine cleavage system H lipoate-binding protein
MRHDVFQKDRLDANAECVWMQAGVVGYKLCDRQFDCDRCPFDLAIRDGGHFAAERSQETSAAFKDTPLAASALARADHLPLDGCEINDAVFYHPGHVWARVEDEGRVRVGLDDFGQRLAGRIYAVKLPAPGTPAEAGIACWRISQQVGDTVLLAPVPGMIQAINPKLAERPSLINRDPYGEGWAFVVQPAFLEQSLKSLYYGERAARWFSESIAQLHTEVIRLFTSLSPDIGTTMTDGGLLVEELHRLLAPGQLQKLIASFLSYPANRHRAKDGGKGR